LQFIAYLDHHDDSFFLMIIKKERKKKKTNQTLARGRIEILK